MGDNCPGGNCPGGNVRVPIQSISVGIVFKYRKYFAGKIPKNYFICSLENNFLN